MDIRKTLTLLLLIGHLASCANYSAIIVSIPSLSEIPSFDKSKTYFYSDDELSRYLSIDDLDISIHPYNSLTTNQYSELLFIPYNKTGEHEGVVNSSPFEVEVAVKGDKDSLLFLPFRTKYNGKHVPVSAKTRSPYPINNCEGYHYFDWNLLSQGVEVNVPDRNRYAEADCFSMGWDEFLIEFQTETPSPRNQFKIELFFKRLLTEEEVKIELFFHGAKSYTKSTH
jgi:hypothetical protein